MPADRASGMACPGNVRFRPEGPLRSSSHNTRSNSVQYELLAQLLVQMASPLLQPAELRHGSVYPLLGGARLLEIETQLEHAFGIRADCLELRAEVTNIGGGFGDHRSLPAEGAAGMRRVVAEGTAAFGPAADISAKPKSSHLNGRTESVLI